MYQTIIDNVISARNAERQKARGSDVGEWHPSGLTDCKRKAVYDFTGAEASDQKDFRSIRIMDRGTNIHEEVQAATIQSIILDGGQPSDYLIEVKVDHAGIKGSSDALYNVMYGSDEDPLYEVHEYKSIGPNGWRFMKGAKPEHIKQARIYHRCLRAQGYNLTDTIRIVYFDRDDYRVEEFEVPAWLDVEWYEFLGEIAELEDHVADGTLPPRMPMTTDKKGKTKKYWLCNYCEYATRCWESDPE